MLLPQQFLSLSRPGHQFGVEANPVRLKLLPESCDIYRSTHLFEKFLFDLCVIEESSSCSRVANPNAFLNDTETSSSGILISAHDRNGAGIQ
jgi:hypothetical protein